MLRSLSDVEPSFPIQRNLRNCHWVWHTNWYPRENWRASIIFQENLHERRKVCSTAELSIIPPSFLESQRHENAAAGLIWTTNAVEGWHNGVTSLFQGSHPPVRSFLEKIRLDSFNQNFNILKTSSHTANQTRKKYQELNKKVRMITNTYTQI